jgi:Super-infection exclusion protein B
MEKFLEKLFDIKKIPTKFLFVIWLSSGLILFVPKKFLTKLNLTDFLKDYGKYIGIAFLISSAFLLVTLINYISRLISRKRLTKKIRNSILEDIKYLDIHEKALLREFYINNKQTLQMPLDNETVVGLINKHIIYQASSTGFTYLHGVYFTYSMTEIALDNLTPELIDLPRNPTEEDKHRIISQRPNWAKEKSRMEDLFNSRW